MIDTTASWLAALIDGEGSIMLSRRTFSGNSTSTTERGRQGGHYRPVVSIANTNYRLMEALAERVDGQIYEHKVSNTAKSHNPRKRRQWTFRWNSTQIKENLPLVVPWLVLKEEQAELLLEACEMQTSYRNGTDLTAYRGRLDEIYLSIRELNTRGREEEVMPNEQQPV